MPKIKPKKYDNEKKHFIQSAALILITVLFVLSAGLSIYTFFKTKEIVQHPGIYHKHKDYTCSDEDDEGEAVTTGARQLLTIDPALLEKSKKDWSPELNINPNFTKDNLRDRQFPLGYGYTTIGSAVGSFLHNKLSDTLNIFASIPDDSPGQASWYMDYIPVDSSKTYIFDTSYTLESAKAVVVAEEVDSSGVSRYTDLDQLPVSSARSNKQFVFMPLPSTVKLRFFTELSTTGSITIYKESVHTTGDVSLNAPLISLSFDDGWKSVYDAGKPVLDEFGVKSTQFIIAESFRSLLSGYMNLGEVKQLEKEGHEIASHSLRHCNLAKLSLEDAAYDLDSSKKTLESEFGSISGFAYPYGAYNQAVKQTAAKSYTYVRTAETGYTGLLSDMHELRAVTIVPDVSMEEFHQIVDFAIQNKLWLNLVYHKIEADPTAYGVTPDTLRAQINYIESSGTKIMTVRDAVSEITKQQAETFEQLSRQPH